MRYTVLFISAFLMLSCGGTTEEEETNQTEEQTVNNETEEEEAEVAISNPPVIEPGVVGMFQIGSPVPEDLPEDLKSRKSSITVNEEGSTFDVPVNVIYNSFEDMIDLQMEDNDSQHHEDLWVTEMLIHSSYYQTSKEIGVGSTIQEFIEAYPDYTLWYTYVSDRYILDTPDLDGVQFLLDFHDYTKTPATDSDMTELDPADFKEGAKIWAIRVY
ncbi:MAG: hypothetical protein MI810_20175 [Flavobacteriales bacterium]|jgi:hypothetical protein|nr:hypothetical protein [Flavobacteriales bacterium]